VAGKVFYFVVATGYMQICSLRIQAKLPNPKLFIVPGIGRGIRWTRSIRSALWKFIRQIGWQLIGLWWLTGFVHSGRGVPGGFSGGGTVGIPGVVGGISGGSIGISQ
jgi:hypothetical protein